MTDITELAQRMKAAAENVIKNYDSEWFETGRQICTVHKSKVNLISLANPANIIALVEALEKAQQHIARQEQIILNQDESLSIRRGELETAQQERENWRTSFDNERFRADKLKARIVELESRTVTVKLPPRVDSSNVPFAGHVWNCCLDEVEKRLAAAGIKWEAE